MKIAELFFPKVQNTHGKFLLTTIIGCLSVFTNGQAQTISTGGNIVVGSGVVVNSNSVMSLQSGGSLVVMGTLILKNNLVNQQTTPDLLGSGTIELSGTTAQTISGPNVFTNLKIDNSAGVSLTGSHDNQVTGNLTLTNGLFVIGGLNLLLGPAAAVIGTPSSARMIAASGTGQLRKEFSGTGSFTFPVGDNTGTPEYSPVTLTFGSGTFGTGNYAGVNLVNAKFPDANITTSYLNRYWNLTQAGITGINCTATFQYADQDITGSESDLFCVKTDPSPFTTYAQVNAGSNLLTAAGISSMGKFTGAMGVHEVALTAFLEGPYNSGVMNTTLNTSGLIPVAQPYSGSPWNYGGTESVGTVPTGVVDWVLLELRQADQPANANTATVISKRAAFLKSDGTIIDLDGISPVRFYNSNITQNLYPVIQHRNHMAVMANNAAGTTGGIISYNFSTGSSQVFGGINGAKQIGTNIWGLTSADANSDGSVYANDYTGYWLTGFGTVNTYNGGDFNLDGNIYATDYTNFWLVNFGRTNPLP